MREARRRFLTVLWIIGLIFVLYQSPAVYARSCPENGSFTSNKDLSVTLMKWFADRNTFDGEVRTSWQGNMFTVSQQDEVIKLIEFGKFSLWDPIKPNYPNQLFAFFGGIQFVIFDRCGNIVAARG